MLDTGTLGNDMEHVRFDLWPGDTGHVRTQGSGQLTDTPNVRPEARGWLIL